MSQSIKIGTSSYHSPDTNITGKYVSLYGESFYCIENYDQMPPFFMSLVSSTDHWMFISSTGGLTAGRQNAESAIFPYYTDDKVTENSSNTGPLSIFLVTREGNTSLWEPFSDRYAGLYQIEHKLYKNISGNQLIFEEHNLDLGLTFRQSWRTSDRFGFILTSRMQNHSGTPLQMQLLSGVQNILPYGVTTQLQSTFSNLLNAYKRSELEPETGLGIFSLSSTLTDLAEPSESLKASTVWQVGLEAPIHLLSIHQIEDFRRGDSISPETDICGYRGAYLLHKSLNLPNEEESVWHLALEVNQDSVDVAALVNFLKQPSNQIVEQVEADIASCSQALDAIIASADGLQESNDHLSCAHHYANILFNTMRGGIFANNYQAEKADLINFLHTRNRTVLESQATFLKDLPDRFNTADLMARAGQTLDPNLERLCLEYLPLTFSRRHGDPSRPWNKFSINLKNKDGSQRLDYQGNWRDLFQNWEALACSYPEFVESMIAVFVNAGTPDGYNPYRVSRSGVEWEVPDPDNPWANIGYWSDHQIIYLEKLMELSAHYHPGKLRSLLNKRIFTYVNVPYRLKAYASLLKDPYKTIDFDFDSHHQIEEQVAQFGSDGKLVRSRDQEIYHVTLSEKLLVFLFAKLVNFVPEGGIWMNTQRPEWNDANNALVGKGLSVVTLGYLHRYIAFLLSLLENIEDTNLEISQEVKTLYNKILSVFLQFEPNLSGSFSSEERRAVMDALGQAGSDYRWNIYQNGFSGDRDAVQVSELKNFLELVHRFTEHSLHANRRADGLFHAYNILKLGENTAKIGYLYEMLEGQVSILSSGLLSTQEALAVLRSLRQSALFRSDQHSYILYPDRDLPSFIEKNLLPKEQTVSIDLVNALIENHDTNLILQDENGDYHFNGTFRNNRDIHHTLEKLAEQDQYAELVKADEAKILDLFEEQFQHESFTGRSGSFFAYEGLGSIYWHMVSKLLLAAQENLLLALNTNAPQEITRALADCYYDIRLGLGFNKFPQVYGAFPTDPYSHTPKGQGAKQPGMTGQVKEEILTRQVELGIIIDEGQITFDPALLREEEFTNRPTEFRYFDLEKNLKRLDLPANALAFTLCQTPVICRKGDTPGIQIHYADSTIKNEPSTELDFETSQHIFKRDGFVAKIIISLRLDA